MTNIHKIEEELNEIINILQHESIINPNTKHLLQMKLKKTLFDVKVLKEILDENEIFSHHNKTHKIPPINNTHKLPSVFNFHKNNNKQINELFEKFKDSTIPINLDKNKNNQELEEENEFMDNNNIKKVNSIENISLIPKNISNSSFSSSDLDLDK